jgi:hypothetical protein
MTRRQFLARFLPGRARRRGGIRLARRWRLNPGEMHVTADLLGIPPSDRPDWETVLGSA